MERVNGNGTAGLDGFEPPPSSMLATHVRPGSTVPHLNQASFAQLLEESLGQNQDGRSNLEDDPVLNRALVMIVVQVGIDPLLHPEVEDPFRSSRSTGKVSPQLQQCLAVLHLAVTRTRYLLYQDVNAGEPNLQKPLFAQVIPKLLSLATRYQDPDVARDVFKIVAAGLHDEKTGGNVNSSGLVDFMNACLAGLLNATTRSQNLSLADEVTLEDGDFVLPHSSLQKQFTGISELFSIATVGRLLLLTCQLVTFILQHQYTKMDVIRLHKQSARLQSIVDDVYERSEDALDLKSLKAEVASLSLASPTCTQSFSTVGDMDEWPDSGRARKRPRMSTDLNSQDDGLTTMQQIVSELTLSLNGRQMYDLMGLSATVTERFKTLSEDEQCACLNRLGRSACQIHVMIADKDIECPSCDEGATKHEVWDDCEPQAQELLQTLLVLKPWTQRRPRVRIQALHALRRIASHIRSFEPIKLKGSAAGEWCLQAMRSPSRELKIAACRTLQAFVHGDNGRDASILHENRVHALEFLHMLWKDAQASSQESVIMALTQIARVVGDEDINIILLRLVDYLGHENAFLSALVYSEIQQLAQYMQLPVAALFRPYWRTLSVVIIQNLSKRPAIAQQVGDLTGMPVDVLLQTTIEEHVVPYLVLNKDLSTIQRICSLSNSLLTPFDLCTKQNNFPKVIALLMTQAFSDPEQSIMDLLGNISEEFKERDLASWLPLYLIEIACELLKSIGDAGPGRAARTYEGLQFLAHLQSRRSRSSPSSSRRSEVIAWFLEQNALAIVTYFTTRLNNTAIEPNIEKRRYLVALGEVIKMGKTRVKIALPHICACLRAAMDDPALCNTAFGSWSDMMINIEEDEVRNLVNQTFVIIVKYWHTLNSGMQSKAYELVAGLVANHETIIRDVYKTLPSLASIPVMSKFETGFHKLKKQQDERNQLASFVPRLKDENMIVVEQALYELSAALREKQDFVQKAALNEQPDTFIADITRATLDACVKFRSSNELLLHAGQCLGSIGCLDPSKTERVREKKNFVLLHNFGKGDETVGFLMFFMEQILVKEYVSSSNLREKGFLAWSLQRLLQICDFPPDITSRARVGGLSDKDRQWFDLTDITRLVLTPFLSSKFVSTGERPKSKVEYPFFKPHMNYKTWLMEIALDFLNRGSYNKDPEESIAIIFDICSRLVVKGQGTSVASFLLPYIALNLLLAGTEEDRKVLVSELLEVLKQSSKGTSVESQNHARQCSQSVFDILDYMSLWLQHTRKQSASAKARIERGIKDPALDRILAQTQTVESVLARIPPQVITQTAVECKSFARALFHQEQFVMSQVEPNDAEYRRLQDIYAQIDEPDGIEGYSAQMKFLDVESEVMEHKKAGRWIAAQSWYEMRLTEQPADLDIQVNLLKCLKESGQHDVLMHHFDGIVSQSEQVSSNLLPFAIEAAWATNNWDKMAEYLTQAPHGNFEAGLAAVMLALKANDNTAGVTALDQLFQSGARDLTQSSTVSFQASHEPLLKMHILDDVRIMMYATTENKDKAISQMNKKLEVIGSNVADKQYVLGVQRAIMQLNPGVYKEPDIAASWLTSARLARKAQATLQAFNAVLRGSALGDKSAAIEQAKLMWQEGNHRKAIQTLEGAIKSGAFGSSVQNTDVDAMTVDSVAQEERNEMNAKAYVLLGKWLDQAGQTQSEEIIKTFRKSTEQNRRWEQGWYNLGHHYNKILESEKSKPPGKESQPFLTGEAAKLVIDNFLRALVSGNKYMFQTLPKVLTLWLDLVGSEIDIDPRRGNTQFHQHNKAQRKKVIIDTNATIKKYLDRIQPYALYTILPQLVARICHTDAQVNELLQTMIAKVVKAYPQQALWTVLATVKSGTKDRATRGLALLRKAGENSKKESKLFSPSEMRDFITASQKFSDELLRIADYHIEGRVSRVSLARDFGFNHKIAPSKLVVPSEACLIPNIPSNNDTQANKSFRAFAKEPITISAFLDEARVLPSLQKPRKLSLRGSDGTIYSVLAKPHDDLRKDQRLMEFNTMINRFLKHDIDAAKRRLYIKTYAVIPLNEECGLIEWVDGLTTMRDILLKLYDQRGIKPDYGAVRSALDQINTHSQDKGKDFIDKVQSRFPPVLQQWFVENFPDPTAWLGARMRYTRSSAVMSMVGHVLGLGDRHGENILLEEGTGGVLHVDFNCLFDKGLTFEKPECVPFRLTHNMSNAMGCHKYEGPFRRSCEITTSLLRNNEDGLMTVLETFLHDPTTDFQTTSKKRKAAAGYAAGVEVPDTPERMLEGVKGKVRGMLPGESVPLSVGGYVDYMVKQAKDEANLAMMYIGWCAFF